MSGQQWGWNLDVKASECASREVGGGGEEVRREAAHYNTVVQCYLQLCCSL